MNVQDLLNALTEGNVSPDTEILIAEDEVGNCFHRVRWAETKPKFFNTHDRYYIEFLYDEESIDGLNPRAYARAIVLWP